MALRTRGIITQVKKEDTFNTAPSFVDDDIISAEKVDVNPKVDTVERKVKMGSMIAQAGIPVRFTTAGSISMELDAKTGENTFYGDVLFEAGLGYKLADGATIDVAGYKIDKKPDADGDATLYSVSDGEIATISLAIKKYFDSGDVVLQSLGNIVSKTNFEFKQADILGVSFDLEGASYQTLAGQTKPNYQSDNSIPFVGKNATFTFDGVTVCAKDIKVEVENKITSVECITSDGYGSKDITEKKISGSFVCLLENFDYLNKLTNGTSGELFLNIASGTKQVALYLPQIKLTDVPITDDSDNLIEVTVNFIAEKESVSGEALLLALKS